MYLTISIKKKTLFKKQYYAVCKKSKLPLYLIPWIVLSTRESNRIWNFMFLEWHRWQVQPSLNPCLSSCPFLFYLHARSVFHSWYATPSPSISLFFTSSQFWRPFTASLNRQKGKEWVCKMGSLQAVQAGVMQRAGGLQSLGCAKGWRLLFLQHGC